MTFDKMTGMSVEDIRVTDFGVFIHPGNTYLNFAGCKGLCATYGTETVLDKEVFFGYNTKSAIDQVKQLYTRYEHSLTGDKFILKTNSTAPSLDWSVWGTPPRSLIRQ